MPELTLAGVHPPGRRSMGVAGTSTVGPRSRDRSRKRSDGGGDTLVVPDLRMTVTDYDEQMLEPAGELLKPAGGRVEVRAADATALPFDDETFDWVFSFIMLHHVIKWETALEEVCRVLKPHGWLVGYDLLSTWPMRAVHQVESSYHRMIETRQLVNKVDELPLRKVVLRPGMFGLVVRFMGRKEG